MQGAVVFTLAEEVDVARSDPHEVVKLVNENLIANNTGTEVKMTADGRGYGLFATRPFRVGQRVATYGGRIYMGKDVWDQVDRAHSGYSLDSPYRDYVVGVTEELALDTGLFFDPRDAGRYVNESALGQNWMANVRGNFKKRSAKGELPNVDYFWEAKKPIASGEEIIGYYGEEYGRSKYGPQGPPWRWYNRVATPELLREMEEAVRVAERRGNPDDIRAARAQWDNKERQCMEAEEERKKREKKKPRVLECQLCGNLAQHQEAWGRQLTFCNEKCQLDFYQREKK